MERYKHPIARDIEEKARRVGGHGGMDFIMDYRLVYCLRHGLPLDQDVYDAAEWSCIRVADRGVARTQQYAGRRARLHARRLGQGGRVPSCHGTVKTAYDIPKSRTFRPAFFSFVAAPLQSVS